jgi:soluble lytic murein transglycosylase-like protein
MEQALYLPLALVYAAPGLLAGWGFCDHLSGSDLLFSLSSSVFSAQRSEQTVKEASTPAGVQATVTPVAAEVRAMDAFLKRHQVDKGNRSRLAESIVASAGKYDLNPRLLASIMIVESRGNPFAISGEVAIGIMQIHLPTWGLTADREDINLFKIEDNIDFGARILKDYVRRFGTWEGVKRYNGFMRYSNLSGTRPESFDPVSHGSNSISVERSS